MKSVTGLFLALSLTSLFAVAAPNPPAPVTKEVSINVTGAYIPAGFDSTSDVYVVTNMLLPNSCYKWSRAAVTHVTDNLHEVRSFAAVTQNTMCLMMIIPLNEEVSLGQLVSGKHTVRFVNGDGTYLEKDLTIQ